MNTVSKYLITLFILALTTQLRAGSATWNLSPASNDWNTAGNWTPATIPSRETDVATFGVSNVTDISCGDAPGGAGTTTIVGDIVFTSGASSYTIQTTPAFDIGYPSLIEIHGGGVTNSSAVTQNLLATNTGTNLASGRIYFYNSASAGDNVVITNQGGGSSSGDGIYGGVTYFLDSSTVKTATIINEGSAVSGTHTGGSTSLQYSSSAQNATFINNASTTAGAAAGFTWVLTLGSIGSSTFIANPASVPGAEGGWVEMDYGITSGASFVANGAKLADCQAGQIYIYGGAYGTGEGVATLTGNGGDGSEAEGGLIDLFALPRSDQTIVIANAGANGGLGGSIVIEGDPKLDLGQFQLFGNGTLDMANATAPTISIGSLSGSGIVLLSGHTLKIGNNNFNTIFSGIIQDAGGLNKAGTGALTLSGANTYTGTTTISAGVLTANNRSGSATGNSVVKVNVGTLGGKGIISGTVTIGTGSGSGAVLAPSVGSNQPTTFTLKRTLTLKADSAYSYKLNTNQGRADQVVAKGVTIQAGAEFSFQPVANKKLANGTIFTAISNTAATAISGIFANLPDGSTFTAGRNNYQVSYAGGDGNDLTLTVVP